LTPESIFSIVNPWLGNGEWSVTGLLDRWISGATTGFDWDSQGIIFRSRRLRSIVEIKRIKGPIVKSKDAAEDHGLKLCKDWVDKQV